MNLDLLVLAVLVLFAVLGALSGALRQLVRLGSAVLAYLAARHLAQPLAAGFTRGVAQPLGRAVAGVLLFSAVFLVARVLGGAAAARLGRGGIRGPADRGLGALLGAAKAGLATWVLLSALSLVGRPLGPAGFRIDPREGDFAALVAEHNALEAWAGPQAATLRRVLRAIEDPRAASLKQDGDVRALLDDPGLQGLLARRGAAAGIEGTPEALKLLSDPAFLDRLEKAQRKIDRVR